ncbi:protransforming growth factor alpha [Ambystoma mexicanum]|uniref:protransforming growth factor alpha n=1 Tax=Ambystoma mexicanum TaxID=8296 RepID=UPI0037E8DA87
MLSSAMDLTLILLGCVAALTQASENATNTNTTSDFSEAPMAAQMRSHFGDCPRSHVAYCFHGSCRFIVQENVAACVCNPGFIGSRCEHADLLAVVAANQKKQTITVLVVVSVVACVLLITACVLIHCCRPRQNCDWCRSILCRQEKPAGLLNGRTSCCQSETVV